MSDLAEDLKTFLQGITVAGDQVFYDRAPQDAPLPFLVITETQGGETVETLVGAAPLAQSAWHVYAYSVTRPSANMLAEDVRKQLQRYSGMMGSTWVDNVSALDYRDTDVDQPVDGDYAVRYWTRIVYDIWAGVSAI